MRILRSSAAAGLLSLLVLSGCSSESREGDGGRDLFILTCSLGCNNGEGGEQVSCSVIDTYQNQEISILFSEPIDLFSVNSSSFRVVDTSNGTSPTGQFFIDPLDNRRLIFRPSLSFDENGNAIFGFKPFTTYKITIPGTEQGDPPPFITSSSGQENSSRLACTVYTSQGIIDPVAGDPVVEYFVTTVTDYDEQGDPSEFQDDVQILDDPEATNVWRETNIRFDFNEVMNIATLLNPATGSAPFLKVERDEDGNLATLDDRDPIPGFYTFTVDQEELTTSLLFNPDGSLPSAGSGFPDNPVRIAVTIPDFVQDLVGNGVTLENGGGTRGFVTEEGTGGNINLPGDGGEDFLLSYPDAGSNEDGNRSGALWGGGRLAPGVGGSGGRLGDLIIPSGTTLTLNTEVESFPLGVLDGLIGNWIPDIIGNPDPVQYPNTIGNFPDTADVFDGAFDFGSIVVKPNATLRLEGENAGRIFSRGPLVIEAGGTVDLSGVSATEHDSGTLLPSQEIPLVVNAANGGDGGFGGDRFDMGGNFNMFTLPFDENDPVDIGDDNLFGGSDPNGRAGQGVGRKTPVDGDGRGLGGPIFPLRYPTQGTGTDTGNNAGVVNFNKSAIWDITQCRSFMVGAPGGGGAYSFNGGDGLAISPEATGESNYGPPLDNNAPVVTNGGDKDAVGLEPESDTNDGYARRLLEPDKGNLRGGSGGGGGGNHPFGAKSRNPIGGPECVGSDAIYEAWHDHSGAQGGYGGGAVQAVSGKSISVEGVIDARGGSGGSARLGNGIGDPDDFGQYAMPGGGGSGGAVLLQSRAVSLSNPTGSVLVDGGAGGAGVWTSSVGGEGSPGLVRIEDTEGGVTRAGLAPFVRPFDAVDYPNSSVGFLSVDNGLDANDGPGWLQPRLRPSSISGSSSCWIRPEGNFFSLEFSEDDEDPNTGDPTKMGWNMDVIWVADPLNPVEELVPFRGANGVFANSFETEFGKFFGPFNGSDAAPIVVRFQGARAVGDFDRCDFDINDPNSGIEPGSLTPWVDHPFLLNEFSPAPNMIRFVVLFDGTVDADNNDEPGLILTDNIRGVTALEIKAFAD